jgi:hypothetical protein
MSVPGSPFPAGLPPGTARKIAPQTPKGNSQSDKTQLASPNPVSRIQRSWLFLWCKSLIFKEGIVPKMANTGRSGSRNRVCL